MLARRSVNAVVIVVAAVAVVVAALLVREHLAAASHAHHDSVVSSPVAAEPQPAPRPPARPSASSARWARVLATLDRRRDAAWRAADPARLARVFLSGSVPLRRDRALLAEYRNRQLTVHGVQVRFLRVAIVDRSRRRIVLTAIDRLGRVQVTRGSTAPVTLPRDQPSHDRIVLVATPSGWRISAIHRM